MGQGLYLSIYNRSVNDMFVTLAEAGSGVADDLQKFSASSVEVSGASPYLLNQYIEGSGWPTPDSQNRFKLYVGSHVASWRSDFIGYAADHKTFTWDLKVGRDDKLLSAWIHNFSLKAERGYASQRCVDYIKHRAFLFELNVKDCSKQICIDLTSTQTPIDTKERDLSHLANNEFHIRNRWRCDGGEYRCGMHLSFTGDDLRLYPKDNTADLVPWKLEPVPGTKDQFYIRNRWGCQQNERRCNDHVSFTGSDVKLYPKDNTADLTPWKLIPVPNTTNQYYFRNRWHYGQGEHRSDYHLSFSGTDVEIYPPDKLGDLTPWELAEL